MDLYLVHGWKVEGKVLDKCLTELRPEIFEIGMRLVFPKNEKHAFFGEILAKVESGSDVGAVGVAVPEAGARERLAHGLKRVGLDLGEAEAPLLWLVLG